MSKKRTGQNSVLRAPKKNGSTSKKNKRNARKSFLWGLTKWIFILGLWCVIILTCVLAWFAADLPDVTRAASFEKQTSIIVKADNGEVIARYGETKGKSISADKMPKNLINAVIATEDRRFYDHPGIDILGVTRAVVVNSIEGRYVQGGSTITQQLAKNLFLTHERTLKRKIQEALLALWLEHQLTKDEILTAYLNRVYLGSGVYGMDAAAQIYFKKSVNDINLREAATLAGLLKAPSRYSPLNNPKLAKERADVVLMAMADAGYITEDQAKGMAKDTTTIQTQPSNLGASKYFSDWVIDGLDDLIGTPEMDLIVETTLDNDLQISSEKSLNSVLAENGKERAISQGAILVMRPDGAVISMVGGRDYNQSQFNRAVQAQRSPGSAFKPFVFITALENGWTPQSIILDAPITEGKYRPENYGGKYYGDVMLSDALALSLNTATIRLMQDVGVNSVLKTARKMGILSTLDPNLSSGLGSSGVNMLELTTAYATLANGGHRVFPFAIKRIVDSQGHVLYERKKPYAYQRVLNTREVANITMMMQGVIDHGTGQRAKLPFPVAGKTGTSQDSRDAWFVGFTDRAVASVWLGNDNNSPMKNVTGGIFPAQIWHDVMNKAYNKNVAMNFGAEEILPAAGEDENHGGGFSNLLGRLLSNGDTNSTVNNQKRNDFSGLNQ